MRRWILGLLSVTTAAAAGFVSEAGAEGLRYGWKPGDRFTYAVKLAAGDRESAETLSGSLVCTVRPAAPPLLAVHSRSTVFPERKGRRDDLSGGFFHRYPFLGLAASGAEEQLLVDATGRVEGPAGEEETPHLLSRISRLLVEPLPSGGRSTWETENRCRIPVRRQLLAVDCTGAGPDTPAVPALERILSSVVENADGKIRVKKRYELRTEEAPDDAARISLDGEGLWVFDARSGVPRSLELRATLTGRDQDRTERIPLTIEYRLLERGERRSPDTPLGRLVAALGSPEPARRLGAARRLAEMKGEGDRKSVARALLARLDDDDAFVRSAAARALATWGDEECVPALVRRLGDGSFAVRWAAMDALGALKDPRAAEPLARRLRQDSAFASRALLAMGPAAAPAVAKCLRDPEWTVRLEACRILKQIGTRESLQAVQAAARDPNRLVSFAAEDAVRAISRRP